MVSASSALPTVRCAGCSAATGIPITAIAALADRPARFFLHCQKSPQLQAGPSTGWSEHPVYVQFAIVLDARDVSSHRHDAIVEEIHRLTAGTVALHKEVIRPDAQLNNGGDIHASLIGWTTVFRYVVMREARPCNTEDWTPPATGGGEGCASRDKGNYVSGMDPGSSGAPCRTRTCGLLVRSQTLYPAELRAHGAGARQPCAGRGAMSKLGLYHTPSGGRGRHRTTKDAS
jgi:hypothetical protein